jgi:hypothetical protein
MTNNFDKEHGTSQEFLVQYYMIGSVLCIEINTEPNYLERIFILLQNMKLKTGHKFKKVSFVLKQFSIRVTSLSITTTTATTTVSNK